MQVLAKELSTRRVHKWDAHGDEIRKKVLHRLRTRTAKNVRDKLEGITKGRTDLSEAWEHEVTFRVRVYIVRGGDIRIWADPWKNKEIWHWVSRGTKPHVIEAKRAKTLVFQWGFARYSPPPKSYPRMPILPAGGGGGAQTVAFKRVHHPGGDPRNFEERAMEDFHIARDFRKDVREGIADWEKEWSIFK
jgi:hypothetical protein